MYGGLGAHGSHVAATVGDNPQVFDYATFKYEAQLVVRSTAYLQLQLPQLAISAARSPQVDRPPITKLASPLQTPHSTKLSHAVQLTDCTFQHMLVPSSLKQAHQVHVN